MSNLRNSLIRLAHDKPELRKHLLPMLKEAYGYFSDGSGYFFGESKGVEIGFNPSTLDLQIGLGGEWWSLKRGQKLKRGQNILLYKRGRDPEYPEVLVSYKHPFIIVSGGPDGWIPNNQVRFDLSSIPSKQAANSRVADKKVDQAIVLLKREGRRMYRMNVEKTRRGEILFSYEIQGMDYDNYRDSYYDSGDYDDDGYGYDAGDYAGDAYGDDMSSYVDKGREWLKKTLKDFQPKIVSDYDNYGGIEFTITLL